MAAATRAAGVAVTVTHEAGNAPPLAMADPEAVTDPGDHEPTRVGVIAGRVKPGNPLAPQRQGCHLPFVLLITGPDKLVRPDGIRALPECIVVLLFRVIDCKSSLPRQGDTARA